MSRFGNSTWAGSSSVFPPQQQSAPELALTAPTTATTNGSGSDADSSSFELAKKSINQCYQQDSSTVDSFPEFGRQGMLKRTQLGPLSSDNAPQETKSPGSTRLSIVQHGNLSSLRAHSRYLKTFCQLSLVCKHIPLRTHQLIATFYSICHTPHGTRSASCYRPRVYRD